MSPQKPHSVTGSAGRLSSRGPRACSSSRKASRIAAAKSTADSRTGNLIRILPPQRPQTCVWNSTFFSPKLICGGSAARAGGGWRTIAGGFAVVFHNLGSAASCFGPAEDQYRTARDTEEQRMRSEKVAPLSAATDPRIAKIEQMTLEEITAFTSRMMSEIITEKVTPKEARVIDRAVGKRLKVIEQNLKNGRISA
jgi:hypothetical protein